MMHTFLLPNGLITAVNDHKKDIKFEIYFQMYQFDWSDQIHSGTFELYNAPLFCEFVFETVAINALMLQLRKFYDVTDWAIHKNRFNCLIRENVNVKPVR